MAPTPKSIKRQRELARNASFVRSATVMERQFLHEEATEIDRLRNQQLIYEKEVEVTKSELDNFKNLLLESNDKLTAISEQNTVLLKENQQLTSNLALSSKEVASLQNTVNVLSERVEQLSRETVTGGKALKQYEHVQSRETKKSRYDRIVDMISKLVGPLNVDAFLQDFIELADEDPHRMFSMKLSPWDSFFAVVKYQLSDGFLKDFKALTKERLRIDIFASRKKINEVKNEFSCSKYYDFELKSVLKPSRTGKEVVAETAVVKANDVKTLLARRLEILSRYDRLKFDEATKENIVIGVGADKGADTTKLAIILENVDHPNDPHAILLVGLYTGNDSHELMKENLSSVFKQIDELNSISYFDGEKKVERKIVKKVLGDCKCISSMYGHAGQNSKMPCYICNIPWATHGKNRAILRNFDFMKSGVLRTLAQLQSTGVPLVHIDPTNAGPPGIHTVLGIVQYYILNWLIALAIKIDTNSSVPADLKAQRKKLKQLSGEVEELQSIIDSLENSLETIENIKSAVGKMHKKTRLRTPSTSSTCSSPCCVVGCTRKSAFPKSSLFQCQKCKKDVHDVCALIVTDEDHFSVKKKEAKCLSCRYQKVVTVATLSENVADFSEKIQLRLQQHEDLLQLTEAERIELESHFKGSIGSTRQLLEVVMRSIGCDSRIWYQDLTGNQVRKLLRPGSISRVLGVFTSNPAVELSTDEKRTIQLMRLVMEDLSFIMTSASNSVKTDEEIEKIDQAVKRFAVNLRTAQPEATATPKLHLLCAHLVPFLKLHRSWARVTEQGIESLHALINSLNIRYASVRNPIHKAVLIIDRMAHFNLIFDVGSSWFRE